MTSQALHHMQNSRMARASASGALSKATAIWPKHCAALSGRLRRRRAAARMTFRAKGVRDFIVPKHMGQTLTPCSKSNKPLVAPWRPALTHGVVAAESRGSQGLLSRQRRPGLRPGAGAGDFVAEDRGSRALDGGDVLPRGGAVRVKAGHFPSGPRPLRVSYRLSNLARHPSLSSSVSPT